MLFEFILFLLLGLAVFVPLQDKGKQVAMIVFVVLMVLWIIAGVVGWHIPFPK